MNDTIHTKCVHCESDYKYHRDEYPDAEKFDTVDADECPCGVKQRLIYKIGGGEFKCPDCGRGMDKLGPSPAQGVTGEPRYQCKPCSLVRLASELGGESGD